MILRFPSLSFGVAVVVVAVACADEASSPPDDDDHDHGGGSAGASGTGAEGGSGGAGASPNGGTGASSGAAASGASSGGTGGASGGANGGATSTGGSSSGGETGEGGAGSDAGGSGGEGGDAPVDPPVVNGCVAYLDRTAPGASRTLSWDAAIGESPERCLRVSAGQSVTWAGDFDDHPFEASPFAPGSFDTAGDAYTVTFAQPGAWGFVCTAHTEMNGAIWVTP